MKFLPHLVGLVDALKVKRAKESGGDCLEYGELISDSLTSHYIYIELSGV